MSVSNEFVEEALSPRDVPLWVRGVAVGLLGFASWWLHSTEALRGVLGDSIALLSLGVIAVFILRGMQVPIGFWPEGPWRERFAVPALLGAPVAIAAGVLVARSGGAQALTSEVDLGLAIATVVGAIIWGFAIASVHQRPFVVWYVAAVGLAVLPQVVGIPFSSDAPEAEANVFCLLAAGPPVGIDVGVGCRGAALPAFVYLFAVGVASKLVTEEIAFRRLLIGRPAGAGLLLVLVAAAVAVGWDALIMRTVTPGLRVGTLLALGAVTAGGLFVLSRSLLVSAAYSASAAASLAAFSVARQPSSLEELIVLPPNTATMAVASVTAVGLAYLVFKQNGWLGDERRWKTEHATGAGHR